MPQNNPIGFDGSGGFGGAFYAAFKHVYGPKQIQPIVYNNNPFLRDLRKVDDFEGDSYMHTIVYEDPDAGSDDFTTAIGNASASTNMSQTARMAIFRGRTYQTIQIKAEEVRASRSDYGSLLRKKDYDVKRVAKALGRRIDIALHGKSTGNLASFTTGATAGAPVNGTSNSTIQLDTNALCTRFSVGMKVQCASNDLNDGTKNTLMNGGAIATITGITRSASPGGATILTLSGTLTASFALTTSTQYWLLRAGDNVGFGVNVLTGATCGLGNWLPAPSPVGVADIVRVSGTDAFWGYNRSVDSQRLAGCTYKAQPGEKYQVTFQNAGQELYVNGGGNDDPRQMKLYVAPSDYTGYSLELGPQVRYADTDTAGTGFRDLIVRTQAGNMTLTADPQVEPGLFYMIDHSTCYLKTLDAVPHLDQQDGLTGLRVTTDDAQQLRWRSWHQLIFDEPGRNLVGRCI